MDITEAKQAVSIAKHHLQEIYQDETLLNLGLEEVENRVGLGWLVTLGFSRPWNNPLNPIVASLANPRRTYKVVNVATDGSIQSIKNKDD